MSPTQSEINPHREKKLSLKKTASEIPKVLINYFKFTFRKVGFLLSDIPFLTFREQSSQVRINFPESKNQHSDKLAFFPTSPILLSGIPLSTFQHSTFDSTKFHQVTYQLTGK